MLGGLNLPNYDHELQLEIELLSQADLLWQQIDLTETSLIVRANLLWQNCRLSFVSWVTFLGCEYLRKLFGWPLSFSSIYLEIPPCSGKSPPIVFLFVVCFLLRVVDLITQLQLVGFSTFVEVSFRSFSLWELQSIHWANLLWHLGSLLDSCYPFRANLLWHLISKLSVGDLYQNLHTKWKIYYFLSSFWKQLHPFGSTY